MVEELLISNHDSTEWNKRTKIFCKEFGRYVIYMLVNRVNGKIYIGKSYNLKDRFKSYKKLQKKTNPSPIERAIKKYGIGNFDAKIIEDFENFTNDNLLDREAFWIKYYNSANNKIGYNAKYNDLDKKGYLVSSETREKMSKARVGINMDYCKKKVKQINPQNNNLIKIWDSINQAAESLGDIKKASGISAVCSGKKYNGYVKKTAYGFGWVYAHESHEDKDYTKLSDLPEYRKNLSKRLMNHNYRAAFRKSIQRIDIKTGKIIDVWSCAHEANKILKLSNNNISCTKNIKKSCGKNKIAYGYYWDWVDKSLSEIR